MNTTALSLTSQQASSVEVQSTAIRHKAAHLLKSGTLSVEVMDPTHSERYHSGVRFSPVANVLRASIGGKDFLFSPLKHDPATENAGLAMEFDISANSPPPGFREAAMGEGFLKIGVGVLQKDTAQYEFFKGYKALQYAQTTATWEKDAAWFEQRCSGANNYSYQFNAKVSVSGNCVEVCCLLANTGDRLFSTEQYSHNFFKFHEAVIGPDYIVRFPYDFNVTGLQPEQQKDGRAIEFAQPFSPNVNAVNLAVVPAANYQGLNELTVSNSSNGMAIRASASLPASRISIHAAPAYLCPEMFVRINLSPGESQQWMRRYEFDLGD